MLSAGRFYLGGFGGSNPFISSTTAGIEIKNGSLEISSHITASGNISSSGTIIMSTASIGGGTFTSASLAGAIAGGGGAVSAVANGSDNRIATFTSTDALNGEAGLTFDGTNLVVAGNYKANGHGSNAFKFVDSDNNTVISFDGGHGDSDGDLTLGDVGDAANGTKIKIDDENEAITISATKGTSIPKRKFSIPSNTVAEATGDVVYLGSTTSMDNGKIYYLNGSGNWVLADADAIASSKGLLAVALGAASNTDGMLIRGAVTLDHDPGTIGDVLYLSTTAGQASSTAPSGTGDVVRIIGYCLDSTNGQILFDPDKSFIELA
jgi:hypothetical protein